MRKSFGIVLVFGLLGLMLGGCQETPAIVRRAVVDYYTGNYAASAALLKPLAEKRDEGYVLDNCRYGSAALAAGDLAAAHAAFLHAYDVINTAQTNDPGRTFAAAAVWEGVKVWKGEPFERAMAHYYLALTFLIQNPPDYENARAAFRNSLFKLHEYAEAKKGESETAQYPEFDTNFALGYLGLGLCYLRDPLADKATAEANFKLAVKYQPGLASVVAALHDPRNNILCFVDYGQGPRRSPKGWYNERSVFGPTPEEVGSIPGVVGLVNGKPATPPGRYDTVDTLALAQDQKWQDIDTIRETKAVIGTGAMAAGAGVAAYGAQRNDTGTALAGLGIMAAGALISALSQADLRYWEMLPRTVYLVPMHADPGEQTIQVQVGAQMSVPFRVPVKSTGDMVLYFRMY